MGIECGTQCLGVSLRYADGIVLTVDGIRVPLETVAKK